LSTIYFRFAARNTGTLQRSPLLERMIARACAAVCVADWRAEAFRAIAAVPLPPIAAIALRAASLNAQSGTWVCLATPVHFVAGMNNLTLSEGGILDLDQTEAEALAADFNRVFGDPGMRLVVGRAAELLCVFDQALDVAARDPKDVVGSDVFSFQPAGTDAPRLRQLMSEMEMWLFGHEVNRLRAARSLLPITGLWLWGGGATLSAMPIVNGWTAGRDPLFAAFGDVKKFPSGTGGGVVVCQDHPGSTGWHDVETGWLAPAMAAVQSGRIERLVLSSRDRRFNVEKGINWRVWRRPLPWWESFEMEGGESNGIQ
jgi:hypothetical protein